MAVLEPLCHWQSAIPCLMALSAISDIVPAIDVVFMACVVAMAEGLLNSIFCFFLSCSFLKFYFLLLVFFPFFSASTHFFSSFFNNVFFFASLDLLFCFLITNIYVFIYQKYYFAFKILLLFFILIKKLLLFLSC